MRLLTNRLHDSFSIALFAILVVSIVLGTPIELSRKDATSVEAGLESPYADYSARVPYVLLAVYALSNISEIHRSLKLRIRRSPFLSLTLCGMLASMSISAVLTFDGMEDAFGMFVDIAKYVAYILILSILTEKASLKWPVAWSPPFLFLSSICCLGAIYVQSATINNSFEERLGFGLVTTFAAKHFAGILSLSCAVLTWRQPGVCGAVLLILTVSACILGAFATGTRGFFLFLAVFTAVSVFPILREKPSTLGFIAFACLIVFATLVVMQEWRLVAVTDLMGRFERRDLLTNRGSIWQDYLDHFARNRSDIFLGIPRESQVRRDIGLPPHNWFLGVVSHHGLPALGFLCVFVVGIFQRLVRSAWQSNSRFQWVAVGFITATFCWAMIENTVFLNAGLLSVILYTSLGLVWGSAPAKGSLNRKTPKFHGRRGETPKCIGAA